MTPLEFLKDEFENVQRALRETLRHDYSPDQSGEYYRECVSRLNGIGTSISNLSANDFINIHAYIGQLSIVASFVSLIERSRLGEFSWPFADELRRISKTFLAETNLKGDHLDPIVHIVAEGQGYRIFNETQVPITTSRRRFLVIAFPRSLKHHVLLHTLFGHEVGHTALYTTEAGSILQGEVLDALLASGPLQDLATMNAWLNSPAAHQDVKNELAIFSAQNGRAFAFSEENRLHWLIELICDLFGLILFGPAFVAAHRAFLQPLHPNNYAINTAQPTHPPFAIRHKMLAQAMHVVGWNTPVTNSSDGSFYRAETEMLNYLLNDPYDQWVKIFEDTELDRAIVGMRKIFAPHGGLAYTPIDAASLVRLVERLKEASPPILAEIDQDGAPLLSRVQMSQTLYAGWVYWMGRQHLAPTVPLDFLATNKLCDHALLQQRAVNFVLAEGVT